MAIIILILSIAITAAICKVINRNTFGTTDAYVRRFVIVWFVVALLLSTVAKSIGLL